VWPRYGLPRPQGMFPAISCGFRPLWQCLVDPKRWGYPPVTRHNIL
jgi:hypothetical protein